MAPCVGWQSQEDYASMIQEILRILAGDTESLREETEHRMKLAARELRFEEAGRLRDVARGLSTIAREQRVHSLKGGDQDVLALARDGELGAAVSLRIRGGLLLGRGTQRFSDLRVAQAREVGAEVMATSCPYCISNFEESRLALEGEGVPEIKDITEVIQDALLESEATS